MVENLLLLISVVLFIVATLIELNKKNDGINN